MIQNCTTKALFLSFIGFTFIIGMDKKEIGKSALYQGLKGGLVCAGGFCVVKHQVGIEGDFFWDCMISGTVGFIGFASADLIKSATKKREYIPMPLPEKKGNFVLNKENIIENPFKNLATLPLIKNVEKE